MLLCTDVLYVLARSYFILSNFLGHKKMALIFHSYKIYRYYIIHLLVIAKLFLDRYTSTDLV